MDRIGGNHRSARTPLWLCLSLIGAAAWIYLSQAGAVDTANARLQAQQQMMSDLTQRHQILLAQLGGRNLPRISSPLRAAWGW